MVHQAILFISALLCAQLTFAQEETQTTDSPGTETSTETSTTATEQPTTSAAERSRVEKVQVTGSHIRRTDIEGPSPVLVIDSEQIRNSGFNSVGQVLRRSTVAPFGGDGESVSLKGIGSGRTLVLVNGQRAPGSGSSYATGAVDPNFVPIAAVDRIEILKDGASATYGSDALGGVVNIITRKDLDGFAFANKYDMTTPNGSDTNLTSLAYGTQSAKSNFLTSVQVSYQQGSRASDFDYAKDLNKSFPFSSNYIGTNGVNPSPLCGELNSLGRCEEQVSDKQVRKPTLGVDWVTDYTRNVGNDVELYTTIIAGYGKEETDFPNAFNTPGETLGIAFTGAETPASWNTLPNYADGNTRAFHRMDDYINTGIEQNYFGSLILGARGYFGNSDWQWDATTNNQININEAAEKNLATLSATKAAVIADTYNPWDLGKRNVSNLGINAMNRNRANVHWFEFKTNGGLGNFLGFDWNSAFGTSAAHFAYADHRADAIINGDVMMQSGVVGKGARELYSVFAELAGVVNKDFELQLSLRGDVYSDFGETLNPKLAMRYQPTNWLTFRSSAGTGFQAPTLQNMNAKIEGYDFLVDQVRCKDPSIGNGDPDHPDCQTQSVSVFQDNNANLKEETSQSLNFGIIVEPTRNFSAALDWWYVKVEDTIGTDLNDILRLEQISGAFPGNYGVTVIRDGGSPTGRINRITYQLQNAGVEEVDGLDLDLKYKLPTSVGDFSFINETTYLNHYYEGFYQEFGKQQVLGQFDRPRWRNNFTLGWNKGIYNGEIVARSFADTEKRVRDIGKVGSVTQFDIKFAFDPSWAGSFQFGVLNAFNIRPRFDETFSSRITPRLFQRFETYFLTYRQDF